MTLNPDEVAEAAAADGWVAAPTLSMSGAHERQARPDAAYPETDPDRMLFAEGIRRFAVDRERRDVDDVLADAAARLAAAGSTTDVHRESVTAADAVNGLAVLAAQMYVELYAHRAGWHDYAGTAATDIAQNAQTVLEEIALLLRPGYVGGAEARWRGLHELACTTALLVSDRDPAGISARYLAHGERLLADDPAYDQPWAPGLSYYERDYEWLRQSHPVDQDGKPSRFRQRWLFDHARLTAAPFNDWLKPSHAPVHMSSRAVAAGSEQAGEAPAGYTPEAVDQLAWQAGCSFYELVAHLVLLPDQDALRPVRRLAWTEAAHDAAAGLRPGLVREHQLTPAEQRHGPRR